MTLCFEFIEKIIHGKETIQQGQVSFGEHSQSTHLGSCVSIIVLSKSRNVGGLSHVVGRETSIGDYNFAEMVIDYFQSLEKPFGPFDYYAVGGSDNCLFVLEDVERQFNLRMIHYEKLDVLGMYYRHVLLIPQEHKLMIHKKSLFQTIG
ncbi:MAG: hypothetical protein C4527_02125 [Candidatus Omnitrophota bacterium]|nr:MAG: hypothetical protein C4527_02125 [Candidatus Omnitrophota bacterium]